MYYSNCFRRDLVDTAEELNQMELEVALCYAKLKFQLFYK